MTKFTIIGLMMVLATPIVEAQTETVPKWVFQAPQLQGSTRKASGKGATRDAAIEDAALKIMQSYQLMPETGSLISTMAAHGHHVDVNEFLAPIATRSKGFKVAESYEMEGGETYVWCEYKQKDTQAMLDSLYRTACDSATAYLMQGRSLRQQGDVMGAAKCYTNGINLVLPVGYRTIVVPTLMEEVSLALCTEYPTLFDSLQVESLTERFPMEKEQSIPYDFRFRVTRNGQPLKNVPVSFQFTTSGQLTQEDATGEDGIVKCNVQRAPKTDEARIMAMFKTEPFLTITPKLLRYMVENKLKLMSQERAQVTLYTFDKTPYFLFDMNQKDSAAVGEMLTDYVKECKYKITTDTLMADLILSLDLEDSVSSPLPLKDDDYKLVNYMVNISYAIYDRRTSDLVNDLQRRDNKFLQKAGKEQDKMRARAVGILTHKYAAEIKSSLQRLKFDKAKYVYQEAAQAVK